MKWKTQTGEIMDVKDMTDSHLLNSIAYLKRKIPKGAEDIIEVPSFEDTEITHYLNRRDLLKMYGYFGLLAEKRRRSV